MYAAGSYHPPPPAPHLRSRAPEAMYGPPHHEWPMLATAPYPDLAQPPPGPTHHVPSPLSTPPDSSPVDYFGGMTQEQQQQQQWAMHQARQAQPLPGPYVDNSYVPQVKAEGNFHAPPPPAVPGGYGHEQHGSLPQDPFHYDLDSYAHLSGVGGGPSTSGPGPDRGRQGRARAAKRTGACARCRRLKMKCTFNREDDDVCSRCVTGGYECVFPGRKPRAPGVRMVLRQQIREADAKIDTLLSQVNPGPTMATPLTLVPARLPFGQKERAEYRDVLTYLERAAQQAGQRFVGDGRAKFDISALEDLMSDDDSETDEDAPHGADGATSPKRAGSPKTELSLTQPVDTILEVAAPNGIMAAAAMQNNRMAAKSVNESSSDSSAGQSVEGVAGENFWLPGPHANLQLRRLIVERQAAPDILLSGLVTPEDVTALFEIHFKWINPIIPILDENIHSPASVLARCPFLFTIICTVASRYYKEKPHIHGMAIHFAKAAAANAVIDGWKTVEMCQAFALWSVYNPPARRWEEDRAWCYTGIAFRLATELNLSRIPDAFADERAERESHNRTRMWLMCFIMDRCLCIQSGKAWMVQEDATIRDAASWLKGHKYHNQCDGYLTSLTELLIIMSRFVGTVNPAFGTSSVESVDDIDFGALYKAYDDELMAWKSNIDVRHEGEKQSKDPAIVMEITLVHCVFHYCRLVICCCGMQLMTKQRSVKGSELFAGCLQAATSLVKLMVEDFVPSGFVPYFPELVYVHSAFAAVVLLKCLRPEFNVFLDYQQEERIINLVKRLFETWTSDKFAVDERHNTQLYARFLKQLMEPHLERLAQKKRAASVDNSGAPSTATSSGTTRAPSHPSSFSDTKSEPPVSPTSMSAASGSGGSSTSSPVFPNQDPASLHLGDIYATDVDLTKAAAQLAQSMGGAMPDLASMAGGLSWSDMFATAGDPAAAGAGASFTSPFAGGDVTGMMGDECLAAMMGLGDGAWFLSN